MRKSLLEKMCCPFDKHDLKVSVFTEEHGVIHEGIILCSHCQRYYPIIYSIPIMTPDEYRQMGLEAPILEQWGLSIDAQSPDRFKLENASRLELKQKEISIG
ncbi:MAG: hypothetical protein RIC35_03990 [Marinoscillum sp.]